MKQNNSCAIVCLSIFAILTLLRIFNHIPWYDEAHCWTVSEQLGFFDMFKYVKNEGHFFLWYTLIMPFAKLHLYPYAMQILNWSFCFAALILFWQKAPINKFTKILITFSFPFVAYYAIVARCYAIGILLLFALSAKFKDKLIYPKTYSILLILCANTSLLGLFGATAFGLIFLYEFIKQSNFSKKNVYAVSGILGFGVILILYQVLNLDSSISGVANFMPFSINIFEGVFVHNNLLLNFLLLIIFLIPIFVYLFKSRIVAFFTAFVGLLMLFLCTKVYSCNFWHTYFFYIYLIIAFWIKGEIDEDISLIRKIAVFILSLISFIFIFHYPAKSDFNAVYKSKARLVIDFIESDDNLKKSRIIHNNDILYEALPYVYKKDYEFINYCSKEAKTDFNLSNIKGRTCVLGNTIGQALIRPELIKDLVKDDNTYTIISSMKNKEVKNFATVIAINYRINFTKYKCFDKWCFWKVDIKY